MVSILFLNHTREDLLMTLIGLGGKLFISFRFINHVSQQISDHQFYI